MRAKARVIVTQPIFEETGAFLAEHVDLTVNGSGAAWSRSRIVSMCKDAQGLLAFMTDSVDADFVEKCPRLRVIACALKGFDNFDIEECTRRGIWVTAVPDLLTAPTAELALALGLSLGRRLAAGDAHVRSGAFTGWRPALYGSGLAGSTVGILGLGRLGRAISARVECFGPDAIIGYDASPERRDDQHARVDLGKVLRRSDFLFVALPLNQQTRHLVDAAALREVRSGVLIVNVGRGSVVDEGAIATALVENRIGGYAADVFEMEDWALGDRPRSIPPALLADPERTFFTPHVGSAVRRVRREIEMSAARNLVAALNGEVPPDAINDVRSAPN